ncbi:hypothetical protein SAMN05216249_11331 [Acetitomaculum ruminis DSM 5522]|uniref:DUF4829 domain-containing protein n=1 Tax=Acetitomaculum ruminis DSM 5522 TaxID=1120918 RepID=A0A1I0Z4W9_9FIRM|nr:nuclear transport factor 2 family protein [Acetitomaculum ruminis]SFB20789.1 hypothetical protein SAMN05216249_11331 [Acetitomaculum ruminis DSM 5522]
MKKLILIFITILAVTSWACGSETKKTVSTVKSDTGNEALEEKSSNKSSKNISTIDITKVSVIKDDNMLEEQKKVIDAFFEAFKNKDFDTMKSYCTKECVDSCFLEDSFCDMTSAQIESYIDGEESFRYYENEDEYWVGVYLDCNLRKNSNIILSGSGFFRTVKIKKSQNSWLINGMGLINDYEGDLILPETDKTINIQKITYVTNGEKKLKEQKKVIDAFFEAFKNKDFDTMKSYCTDYCKMHYFGDDSFYNIKSAEIDSYDDGDMALRYWEYYNIYYVGVNLKSVGGENSDFKYTSVLMKQIDNKWLIAGLSSE